MTFLRTILLAVPLLACLSLSTRAATYYVATNGNDSYSCAQAKNLSTPKRNITGAGGMACLSAGDRLEIRAGTYAEVIRTSWAQTIPSGSSWTYATTIAAYGSETVTIRGVNVYSPVRYVVFSRLIMDANYSTLEAAMVGNGGNHIRFVDCEAKNSRGQGGVIWSGVGGNEWIRGRIHHNGDNPGLDHGIYITSPGNILDGVEIYNNYAFGVHNYNGGKGGANGNVVKNCRIHNNGIGGTTNSPSGILMSDASSGLIFNNLVYDEYMGISVATPWTSASNIKVFNNTIYSCIANGLTVSSRSTSASVKNNILYQNGYDGIVNNGVSTTLLNNLQAINPVFVNAGAGDLRIMSSSPAINKGTSTAPEVTVDKWGNPRPSGSAYDIGAHEYR